MRLSMWILADYLQEFHPEPHIQSGKMVLRNIRLLSDATLKIGSNVYLGRAGHFIDGAENRAICVHGQDLLLLETEDIDEVFNRILDCFDFYNQWSDSCREKIERGCTIQELMEASREVFKDNVQVVDSSHIVICELKYQPQNPEALTQKQKDNLAFFDEVSSQSTMPFPYIAQAIQHQKIFRATGHAYCSELNEELLPRILRNLFSQGILWGWLMENNIFTEYTEGKRQILEEFGTILEEWKEKNENMQNSLEDFSRIFRSVFLQYSPATCYQLQYHLQNLGWSPLQKKQLCLIEHKNADQAILSNLCFRLSRRSGCVVGIVEGKLVLLLNLELGNADFFYQEVEDFLQKSDCSAGMSYAFTDLEEVNEQKKLAETALRYGQIKGRGVHHCEKYVLRYLKDTILKNSHMDVTHPVVRELEQYDQENETCLLQTLYYFLLKERNYNKTAELLYVHRNTIQYRVEKIRELTGLDLDDDQTRIHVLVSLMLKGPISQDPSPESY